MKIFLVLIFQISYLYAAHAGGISGKVTADGKVPKGTLYIYAKKFDGSMRMPLAVKKIADPQFPVSFELSSKDAMMKSVPFTGPFKITARLSPSGDPMDKSGPEAVTTKAVAIGVKDIQLTLKSK